MGKSNDIFEKDDVNYLYLFTTTLAASTITMARIYFYTIILTVVYV